MRSKEPLIVLLRQFVEVVADEAARNSRFAEKLNMLLKNTDATFEGREKRTASKHHAETLPDIHKEWNLRGEHEFRLWLRHESVENLKAIIRREDLDAARRATKWKDADKLADFITDGLKARMSRGSAFITHSSTRTPVADGPTDDESHPATAMPEGDDQPVMVDQPVPTSDNPEVRRNTQVELEAEPAQPPNEERSHEQAVNSPEPALQQIDKLKDAK